MSVIQEPGSTRPGRAVGLLLIGLAVIAVVLGVITLINGGDDDKPTGSPPPSSNPQTPPPASQTSGNPQNSNQPPQSSTQQPPPPPVTTTTAQPQTPAPPPFNPKQVGLRVFNNSTIAKAAAQAANDFRGDGWNVVEVGNYSETNIATSTAYFRAGDGNEEAAARALGARFNLKVEPRLPRFAYGPGVVVM